MRLSWFSLGVGVTSGASLALSLLFTRIFSVTMYYHFAFLLVSLALLGIAVSGVAVYLMPGVFRDERKAWQAGLFAAAIAPATVIALQVAVANPMSVSLQGENIARLLRLYAATSLPFLASGFAISLAIAAAREHVGRVYAFDLVGAGLGCVLIVPAIASLGAQAAVLAAGATAAAGGALMALAARPKTAASRSVLLLATLACAFAGYESAASARDRTRYPIAQGTKFLNESAVEFERWNAFSRVTVSRGEADYKWIHIDADAATRMYSGAIAVDGYRAARRFSEARVAGLVYALRQAGPALIIGPGGGPDVVSALHARVPRIVGVEVNPLIAHTIMRERYVSYNGDLYRDPRIALHVDDGRSFVRRSHERYSSIQATLVDTWAAAAAGAFALTENNLYTREAFGDYLGHLKLDGVLSMTRWYRHSPVEFLRLLGLGRAALSELGVAEAQHSRHFFIAADDRMASMLLKRTPYAADEIAVLERECAESRLKVLHAPGAPPADARIHRFLTQATAAQYAELPFDISPPSDGRPFFFYTLRAGDFFTLLGNLGGMERNNLGLIVLQVVLAISLGLTSLLVVLPLLLLRRDALRGQRASKLRMLAYFLALGLGYILVELGLMQKFILFLGHPLYALAVVIAALLGASGCGSALSARVAQRYGAVGAIRRVAALLCAVLLLYASVLGAVFAALLQVPLGGRIAIAAALVAVLGFLMGTLLPLGMRVAQRHGAEFVPWAFGLNGATSVVGSGLAVILSMHWGFTATLLTGLLAYAIGAVLIDRPSDEDPSPAGAGRGRAA